MQSLGLESRTDTVGCLRPLVSVYIYIHTCMCRDFFGRESERARAADDKTAGRETEGSESGRQRERERH